MKILNLIILLLALSSSSLLAVPSIERLKSDLESADKDQKKALRSQLAEALSQAGDKSFLHGSFATSLEYSQEALELFEQLNDKEGIAKSIQQIAVTNDYLGYHKHALEYYHKVAQMHKEQQDLDAYAGVISNIAGIHCDEREFEQAWAYYDEAIQIYRESGNKFEEAFTSNNMGLAYLEIGKYREAEQLFLSSLETFEATDSVLNVGFCYQNLAYLYQVEGVPDKARYYGVKGLEIAKKYKSAQLYYNCLEDLIYTEEAAGNFKQALEYSGELLILNDSIFNLESQVKLQELEQRYYAKEQEKDIELLKQNALIKDIELAKKQWVMYAAIGGSLLMMIVVWVTLKSLKTRKEANRLIRKQKQEVELQKDMLDQKNKEMVDSINYASRLQEAILPSFKSLDQEFSDYFVYYQPKDIVSGDFYWMQKHGDIVLFAVIDCTGHGVPGAMVSMVGYNGLNRCIKELGLTEPFDILTTLDDFVENTFEREDLDVKDGMDMALCALNIKTGMLKFAGANNPLWIISKSASLTDGEGVKYESALPSLSEEVGLYSFKASKQPVGDASIKKPFIQHEIQLGKGDMIYIFSDGYTDQFGGPKGKKFKYKPFRDLLLSLHKENMSQQKLTLSETLSNWRGDQKQVDDICVMGVKI